MDHVTKYVCLFTNIFVFSFKSHHINRHHHQRAATTAAVERPSDCPRLGQIGAARQLTMTTSRPTTTATSPPPPMSKSSPLPDDACVGHVTAIDNPQPPHHSLPTTHAHATSPTTTTRRRHIATRAPSPQGMWAPHHCHPPN